MTTAPTTTSTWAIDSVHSLAEFAVKHMMISTVKGRFGSMTGTLLIDEANPTNSSVTTSIDVASIDTREPQRDAHLRSDDFLNAEQFPHITFRSTRVERISDEEWRVTGDLTIRDVTQVVTLDTDFEGRITDPYGKERAGFTAQTTLSRKAFGLKWNALLETGGAVVGDTVKVTLHLEAVRQD
jgi:polyisoprenoid-binding protein YceI